MYAKPTLVVVGKAKGVVLGSELFLIEDYNGAPPEETHEEE